MTAQRLAALIVLVVAPFGRSDTVELVTDKTVQPFAVAWQADGTILFVEMTPSHRLAQLNADGSVTTLAHKPSLNGPHDLLVHGQSVFVADTFGHAVRQFANGTLTTFAGTGNKGYSGDGGPARDARFDEAYSVAMNRDGRSMYVVDLKNRRIRRVDMATLIVHPFAGNGKKGEPKDGELAVTQPLIDPRAVTVDAYGNVYLVERAGHRLRVVKPDGTIHTVAGTGKPGKGGDGGPGLTAAFNGPKYLAVDRDQTVLICDTENHQIRRYVPKAGTVELVAGTGVKGRDGVGGSPLNVQLGRPHGVAVHPKTGLIYIADSDNNRILRVVRK